MRNDGNDLEVDENELLNTVKTLSVGFSSVFFYVLGPYSSIKSRGGEVVWPTGKHAFLYQFWWENLGGGL